MPKKPSTVLTMQDHRPLSTRRRYTLTVNAVHPGKGVIRVEFNIDDDPQQAGRTIIHQLPAILAPNSPLATFLRDGCGIAPTKGQSVDLASLVGRQVRARFSRPGPDGQQQIVAVDRLDVAAGRPSDRPAT